VVAKTAAITLSIALEMAMILLLVLLWDQRQEKVRRNIAWGHLHIETLLQKNLIRIYIKLSDKTQ
jgi:hypothetical protein